MSWNETDFVKRQVFQVRVLVLISSQFESSMSIGIKGVEFTVFHSIKTECVILVERTCLLTCGFPYLTLLTHH